MHCALCRCPLGYVHGHAACLDGRCPMFGVNQAECCSGDSGDCVPTATIATVGAPGLTAAELRLFVYGTLLTGEPEHALLSGAKLAGPARTRAAFKLVDLGPYPALVAGGTLAVDGEVYLVDARLRFALDVKHECPALFQRVSLSLEDGTSAEAYVMREDQVRGRRRLAHGDWRRRFAARPREDRAGPFVRATRDRFKPR